MHIDRGLLTVTVKPYPRGYQAPSTAGINTKKGRIDLSPEPGEDFSESHFPEGIVLKAKLIGCPIQNPVEITLSVDNQSYPPISLCRAHPASAHASVQLRYEGIGRIQWQAGETGQSFSGVNAQRFLLILINENLLYVKPFLFLPEGHLDIHRKTLADRHSLTTPPGEQDIYPLWPYGGFFKIGCRIQEVEQTVFTLTTSLDSCAPQLSLLSSWREKPKVLGKERVRFLAEFDESHHQSLAGDIEKGHITIQLQQGIDERGRPYTQPYQSTHFTQLDPATRILDIFFKRRPEQ